MDTVVLIDDKVIDFFSSEMVLLKVNAEVDTALAKSYHISGYPTIVLTDSKGEEIDRIVGYRPADEFLQTLENYKNGIGTLDDLLSKADTSENRNLYFEIADKYKYRGGVEEAKNWYKKVIDAGEPTDSLSGESRLSIADMYRRAIDYDKSLEAFNKTMKDFKGT
ncbi:MAG: thioredoxin fold domain-containing protein, partial [Candidatus Zixiibacteriota bacterium]